MDLRVSEQPTRATPRFPVTWPVDVACRHCPSGEKTSLEGKLLNISNDGAFIWVPLDIQVGERVQITLDVWPDGYGKPGLSLRCWAHVVHKQPGGPGEKPFGIGVRIAGFDPPEIIAPGFLGALK